MSTARTGGIAGGRISYLFVKVARLDEMRTFYCDRLGFEVVYEEAGACAFLRLGNDPGPQLAFYPGRDGTAEPRGDWFLAIDVDDLDAAAVGLRRAGVEVGEISEVPYGLAATVKDPDGNTVELHQPA
jgi:catechol 2,3-dioxygenase-like lactoylglutathione lyase family enzyme